MRTQQHGRREGRHGQRTALSPDGLVGWISSICPFDGTAVDCGAGLCDLSALLAARFEHVHALDSSVRCLALGCSTANLSKLAADAGALPFADRSADLVISMQALHHFDPPRHVADARRVLRRDGILAALCYGDLELRPPLRRAFAGLRATIEPFWETEKRLTDDGYRTLDFGPGMVEIATPPAALKRKMTVQDISTYLAQSSAGRAAAAAGQWLPYPSDSGHGWAVWPIHGRVFRKV